MQGSDDLSSGSCVFCCYAVIFSRTPYFSSSSVGLPPWPSFFAFGLAPPVTSYRVKAPVCAARVEVTLLGEVRKKRG